MSSEPAELSLGFQKPRINENRLVARSWPAIIAALFFTAIFGVSGGPCVGVGLLIPILVVWLVHMLMLTGLNSLLGKPLNHSAVAATVASVTFFTVAAFTVDNTGIAMLFDFGQSKSVDKALFAIFGSLIFQLCVRVQIAKKIVVHNASDYQFYEEPPCHVRFHIWQMMIFTAAVAVALGIAARISESTVLWMFLMFVVTPTVFFPAKIISDGIIQVTFDKTTIDGMRNV